MKRLLVVIPLFVAPLAACNKAETKAAAKDVPGQAKVENGVQTVTVTVSDMGYSPKGIELKAGIPAKVTFDQQTKAECAAQIMIPSMGVAKTDLPFGQKTTVEFTPKEAGTFTFVCGMDMMKGTILVKS